MLQLIKVSLSSFDFFPIRWGPRFKVFFGDRKQELAFTFDFVLQLLKEMNEWMNEEKVSTIVTTTTVAFASSLKKGQSVMVGMKENQSGKGGK